MFSLFFFFLALVIGHNSMVSTTNCSFFFSQDFLKVCLLLQAYDVNFFLNIGLNHPKVNKRYLKCIPQSDCRLKSLKINSFDFRGNDKLLLT